MLNELKQLTIDYAKQETLSPLKNLGRFLGFGVAGSLFLGIGLVLLVLAALRALQTETGTAFTNHLSWIPYVITLGACVLVIAFCVVAIGKDRRDAQRRKEERRADQVGTAS